MTNDWQDYTLQGLYDDDRRLTVIPSVNGEVVVVVNGVEPPEARELYFFGADLLALVQRAFDDLAPLATPEPTP